MRSIHVVYEWIKETEEEVRVVHKGSAFSHFEGSLTYEKYQTVMGGIEKALRGGSDSKLKFHVTFWNLLEEERQGDYVLSKRDKLWAMRAID